MNVLRFLFGHGWWILWHIAFWVIVLISVVIWLIAFGQELKRPGEKPDPMSPGSIMVLMIALGLGFLTFVDGILFARVLAHPWWLRIVLLLVVSIAVTGGMFPMNMRLAEQQSHSAFWWNVILSGLIVFGNLVMLWFAETRSADSIRLW